MSVSRSLFALKHCRNAASELRRTLELGGRSFFSQEADDKLASRMRIYTRTGDKGTSSLYNGQRLPKDDAFFQALGDVDELNSAIGLAREHCADDARHERVAQQLEATQSLLLDVGSAVATPIGNSPERKLQRVAFDTGRAAQLESWIDEFDSELPPLKYFILPSGGKAAACLHMARSIARRAERSVVPLTRQGAVDEQVCVYLNRLSDYLFTAARWAAMKAGQPEVTYQKPKGV